MILIDEKNNVKFVLHQYKTTFVSFLAFFPKDD